METQGSTSQTHDRYDSNPFTTAWTGVQKLIKTNAQTVVGVAFFSILLAIILAVTIVVMFLATFTFIINHNETFRSMFSFPPNTALSFLTSMSDSSVYLTWVIGLAVCVFVASLTQSLQLNVAVASAHHTSVKFGALLKRSLGSVLPILGFVGLVLLAMVVGGILIGLLSLVLGYIAVLIAFVALLAALYAGLRLLFTTFGIVDLRLGPISAMKYSWKTTEGRLIETIGAGAVGLVAIAAVGIIMDALSRATEGVPLLSGLFELLNGVLAVVLAIAATMALAERYVQIVAIKKGELSSEQISPFNYLAIAIFLILAPIFSALSPKIDQSTQLQNDTNLYNNAPSDSNSYPTLYN